MKLHKPEFRVYVEEHLDFFYTHNTNYKNLPIVYVISNSIVRTSEIRVIETIFKKPYYKTFYQKFFYHD